MIKPVKIKSASVMFLFYIFFILLFMSPQHALAQIIVKNPYANSGGYWHVGQLHAHTNESDGIRTPADLVNAYKSVGYDFVAITDHNVMTSGTNVPGIITIVSEERSSGSGHINTFNISAPVSNNLPQPIIDEVIKSGLGLVSFNHPSWPSAPWPLTTLQPATGYFAIEIRDAIVEDIATAAAGDAITQWDTLLSGYKQVWGTTVDDVHRTAGAEFNRYSVRVNTDSCALSKEDVLRALANGNFYSTTGTQGKIGISISSVAVNNNIVTISLPTLPNGYNVSFYGDGGILLQASDSITASASYTINGTEKYVRIEVERISDNVNAWTNPIFVFDTNDPSTPLTISTLNIPEATQDYPYNYSLSAVGGVAPYSWQIANGFSLPAGLFLSADGIISGNPSNAGMYRFVVEVTDAGNIITATQDIWLKVSSSTFSENFDCGTLSSSWTVVDNGTLSAPSAWFVSGQSLVQRSNIYGGNLDGGNPDKPGTYIYNGDFSWVDYRFNVRVKSNDDDAIGLMFRYQNDNNYYRFFMDKQRSTRMLTKTVGGVHTILALDNIPYNKNQWYDITVDVIQNNIRILVDGIVIFDVFDSTFTSGQIALYSWGNAGSYFDNVEVLASPALQITTASLPGGTVGIGYNEALSGNGGILPYSWSHFSGILPPGLAFDPLTGILSGSPTTIDTYDFEIQLTDSAAIPASDIKAFTVQIVPTPPLLITTDTLSEATATFAYDVTLNASGGIPPYTFSLDGTSNPLPLGLLLSPTGVISGTPTLEGDYTITARVEDSVATSTTKTLQINVKPEPVVLLAEDFDSGTKIGWTIVDEGVQSAPSSWSASSPLLGTLVQSSNIWGGTTDVFDPVKPGSYAYNGDVLWTGYDFSLKIKSTDDDAVGVMFRYTDPDNYYRFYMNSEYGLLMLTKKVNGVVSVIMREFGWFYVINQWYNLKISVYGESIKIYINGTLIFDVTDYSLTSGKIGLFSWGNAGAYFDDIRVYTLRDLTITTISPPAGTLSFAYNAAFTAVGGTLPYTWSELVPGTLPPGLSLNGSNGTLSGVPTQVGSFDFTLSVTDGNLAVVTAPFTVQVNDIPPLVFNTTNLLDAVEGQSYYELIDAGGGVPPYVWQVVLGSLPQGVTLEANTGVLSGIPLDFGTFNFSVQVADSASSIITQAFTLTVSSAPALVITTLSLPDGVTGMGFSEMIAVTNGVPLYTWSVKSGLLPDGLVLDTATGEISGTPSTPERYTFTIEVSDSSNTTMYDSVLYRIDIRELLLQDNFDAGTMSGWIIVDEGMIDAPSRWSATTGVLVQSSNIYDGIPDKNEPEKLGTYAYTGDASWSDYEVSLKLRSTDNDAIGIMFRYQNPDNYYRFSMDKQRSYRRLIKKTGGVVTVLAEDTFAYEQFEWTQINITAAEDNIVISQNGLVVFTVTDSSLSSGMIGLYAWGNSKSEFDDMVIVKAPVLSDKFSSATIGNWIIIDEGTYDTPSRWMIQTGWLEQTSNIYGEPLAGLYPATYAYNGRDWLDYRFIAQLKSLDNDKIGVIFRYQNNDNFYRFTMDSQRSIRKLIKNVNGIVTVLAEDYVAYEVNKEYTVQVEVNGDDIKVYIDNTLIFNVTDASISSGKIGLYSWANIGSMFDDVTVYLFPTLVVTTDLLAQATEGVIYGESLAAKGGTPPYSWSIGIPMPDGLSVSPTGAISGIPLTNGNFNLPLTVTDSIGNTASNTAVLTIDPAPVLQIDTTAIPQAVIGISYDTQLNASGGIFPYTWSLTSGILPSGIILSPDGLLSGISMASGIFEFATTVTDGIGASVSKSFWMVVNSPSLSFFSDDFSSLALGSWSVVDEGTTMGPSSWGVTTDGVLAQVSNIYGGRLIANDPIKPGTYLLNGDPSWNDYDLSLRFKSTDDDIIGVMFRYQDNDNYYVFYTSLQYGFRRLVKKIGGNFTILAEVPFGYVRNQWYDLKVSIVGENIKVFIDNSPIFDVIDSSLATGKIAMYSWGNTGAYFDDVIVSTAPLNITSSSSIQSIKDTFYSNTLNASGGIPAYSWNIVSGALPDGLLLNLLGEITGTPTLEGNYPFTVSVQDSGGYFDVKDMTINVSLPAPLAIDTITLPNGILAVAYNEILSGSGGIPPYTWSLFSGSLPPGVFLSSSGELTGAPTEVGSNQFTVKISDQNGSEVTKLLSMDVTPALVTLLYDDFDSGIISGWNIIDEGNRSGPSNWSAATGSLIQSSNIYGGDLTISNPEKPGTYIYKGDTTWTDYDFTAQVRSNDNDSIGVMFRYQDTNNYYRFILNSQNSIRMLTKKEAGVDTILAQDMFTYVPGQVYTVKISLQGGNIAVYVDEQLIFDMLDFSISSGAVALYSWANEGAVFDNITVQGP